MVTLSLCPQLRACCNGRGQAVRWHQHGAGHTWAWAQLRVLTALPRISAAGVPQAGCFLAFWAMQLGVLLRGMEGIRLLEKYRWRGGRWWLHGLHVRLQHGQHGVHAIAFLPHPFVSSNNMHACLACGLPRAVPPCSSA